MLTLAKIIDDLLDKDNSDKRKISFGFKKIFVPDQTMVEDNSFVFLGTYSQSSLSSEVLNNQFIKFQTSVFDHKNIDIFVLQLYFLSKKIKIEEKQLN